MKKSKKLLSALVALVMVLTSFPLAAVAAGDTVNLTMAPGETKSFSFYGNSYTPTSSDSSVASAVETEVKAANCRQGYYTTTNNDTAKQDFESGTVYSLTRALYTFTSSAENTYVVQNYYNTGVYLNISHWDATGFPNYSTSANTVVQTSEESGNDGSWFYLKSDSDAVLVFGKGENGSAYRRFDRNSLAGLTATYSSVVGCNLDHSASAMLYRPVATGETSSAEIPGYVKLNSIEEITSGTSYLIVYKDDSDEYFVLYPDLSQNGYKRFLYVAKVLPENTNVVRYDLTITASALGTTTITYGDTTYNITVQKSNQVTGAVKYDGVIYTQSGDDITSYGTDIADGSVTGEPETDYEIASGWSIDHVEVAEGAVSSNITASNGKLTGSVQTTNGNNNTTFYDKILLNTYLTNSENDGEVYVQQDYLYVTTSPVPANGAAGSTRWSSKSGSAVPVAISSGLSLTAQGSTSSYAVNSEHSSMPAGAATDIGNSYYSFKDGDTSAVNRMGNAKYLFNDGMSVINFSYTSASVYSTDTSEFYNDTANKLGGYIGYYLCGGSGWAQECAKTIVYAPFAYYYYDTSSDSNYGFLDGSTANDMRINILFNLSGLSGNKNMTSNHTYTASVNTLSTGTIVTALQEFDYTTASTLTSNCHQTIVLSFSSSDASNGIVKSYYDLAVKHDGGNGSFTQGAQSQVEIPISIKVDDTKKALRTHYDSAVTNGSTTDFDVLVSSDFTASSWANYQQKMLDATQYLNNYDYNQTSTDLSQKAVDLGNAYNALQRLADFSELDEQLELKKDYYNSDFPLNADGTQIFSVSSWIDFQTIYANGYDLADVQYGTEATRNTAIGYNESGTEGPHSTTATALQASINSYAEQIKNNPAAPADDTAYVAAKDLSDTIDLDSYQIADSITYEKETGDSTIYVEYPEGSGNNYISPSSSEQSTVDNFTTSLLNMMNVAAESGGVNTSKYRGKYTTIIIQKNGTDVFNYQYGYGTVLSFTFVPTTGTSAGTTQVTADQAKSLYITVTNDSGVTNTIPLDSDNKLKFVAQGTTITINLQYDASASANVIVKDYFDTIIYSSTVSSIDDIQTDDENATVTINGTVVSAKPSAAFTFNGWKVETADDGSYTVTQTGKRIGGVHRITGSSDTLITSVDDLDTTIEYLSGYDRAYTVRSTSSSTPLAWKMEVTDSDNVTRSYLAGYDSSFTRFTSNYDVKYTPLFSTDDLGELADAYGKPVSYGDGYISGDNSDKFTLSCFYSQASGTTVTEAGVLYSTDGTLTPETMTKGADGVSTKIQTRVSDYNTYTMTKTNATTGTHLMRSYACYTVEEQGITVIRVVYGPVYKCENGVISIVE